MKLLSPHPTIMAPKKTLPLTRNTNSGTPPVPTAYARLHALLHTVRCIAQYEDVLCEITHSMKQSGELLPPLNRELNEILKKIPSHAYLSDLDAVRATLEETPLSAKSGTKNSNKSRASGKRAAAKTSGQLSSK
jgi:hypothetical protein